MNLLGVSLVLLLTSCSFSNKLYLIDNGNIICKDKDNGVYVDCEHVLYGKIAGVENAINVIVKYKE